MSEHSCPKCNPPEPIKKSDEALLILRGKTMSAEELSKVLYPDIKDERQLNRTTSILSWLKRQGEVYEISKGRYRTTGT